LAIWGSFEHFLDGRQTSIVTHSGCERVQNACIFVERTAEKPEVGELHWSDPVDVGLNARLSSDLNLQER
jgi:hypothetical protein